MSETDLSRFETNYFKILNHDGKGVYRTSGDTYTSARSFEANGVPYLEQFMPSLYQLHSKKPIAEVYCPHPRGICRGRKQIDLHEHQMGGAEEIRAR